MPIEIVGRTTTSLADTNGNSNVRGTNSQNSSAASNDANAASGDKVSLTGSAAWLYQIQASLDQIPVVDSARVDNIRNAVNNGTYEVNSDRVADKILQMEAMLYQQPGI